MSKNKPYQWMKYESDFITAYKWATSFIESMFNFGFEFTVLGKEYGAITISVERNADGGQHMYHISTPDSENGVTSFSTPCFESFIQELTKYYEA